MSTITPGTAAPVHTLPALAGGDVEVPGDGRLTLLAFSKASCPTCRWAMPFVQSLHERAEGVRVIGIASDTAADAQAFADDLGLTFPVAVESDPWPVSVAYRLQTVPTLFLVDGSGEILLTSPGFAKADLEEVARRAAEVAGGEPADPFPEGVSIPAFRPG